MLGPLPSSDAQAFPGWSAAFQAALERLTFPALRPSRSPYPGMNRSAFRGRALEFVDYRAYLPGDDPRLIDWQVYVRLDRLYLKQYQEERSRSLTLVLDGSASMDFGSGDQHKGRYARRLAAALAWIALCHHETVRLVVARNGSREIAPPAHGKGDAALLFRRLSAGREEGRAELAGALSSLQLRRAAGPVALLSDMLDPAWPQALASLGAAAEGVVIQVLSPEEWDPPLGDEVELEDAESGERRQVFLGAPQLADYRRTLDEFVAGVAAAAGRRGIRSLAVNTATPLEQTVFRDLVRSEILRA